MWGFDGTVRSIAPLVEGGVDTAVEFDVHEWFGIEGPPTVTVDLVAPQVHLLVEPPDYGVGTRLLVAVNRGGAAIRSTPRWRGRAGSPAPGTQPLHRRLGAPRSQTAPASNRLRHRR